MISLIEVLNFLRPGAEWTLNGNTYDGLTWLDEMQTKPSEEEVNEGYIQLTDKNAFDRLVEETTRALEEAYTAAQYVKVVYQLTTYLIPIIGDFFNINVVNQVLEAQVSGTASLLAKDIDGVGRLIKDIKFSVWSNFYKESKIILFDNFTLKNTILFQIESAETIEDLSVIDVNVFPEISTIDLDIIA